MAASDRTAAVRPTAGGFLALTLLASAGPAAAGPITFNTALPVAKDTFVARLQAIHREREDDIAGGRNVEIDGGVAALGYGITGDWTGIAIVPWLDKELVVDTPGGDGSAPGGWPRRHDPAGALQRLRARCAGQAAAHQAHLRRDCPDR